MSVNTLEQAVTFFGRLATTLTTWARAGGLPPGTMTADRVLDKFRALTSADVAANFAESKTPDGQGWKPLKWRIGQPLVLTGTLLAAAVGAFRNAQWASTGRIAVTMNTPRYWQFQNYGTKRIPARRFMAPRPATYATLLDAVKDGLSYELIRTDNVTA